ncbi:phosphoesterase, RecJ domain protein [Thermosipho melanesiensis BI429]|uniref:Phosphoesterase, RecJ domain protein n=1 Tax=Thermosipho melanesiensis (strain DSM 12029 / CIP 104789 / BI429) TaxID=391009 RepID=A6LKS4_THEM4|nr:phosphoesterase, RecJ domain protein [Thermosipho melanesiensis BI429]
MDLEKFKTKKILHTTHKMADCDGIASVYWGLKVFGGEYYIPSCELRSAHGLKNFLDLSEKTHIKECDYIFIYDTDKSEDIEIPFSKPYVIFDHHHKRDEKFFENAIFSYSITSSANVINLYNLSQEMGIELDEKMLFSFAIALYTDTGMFRTARKNEFSYFSKFLGSKKFEDIYEIIYQKKLSKNSFLNAITNARFISKNSLEICITEFKTHDEFYAFIDGLFNVLNLDILIATLPEGLRIHMKKKYVQKIYHILFVPIQRAYNIKRYQGIWLGFYNYNILLNALDKYKGE